MDTDKFIQILKEVESPLLFNPYRDVCDIHDYNLSVGIRTENLRKILKKIDSFDSILIGEAAGYLGCRRTGYAFTDEYHLKTIEIIYGIERLLKATSHQSPKTREQSATHVWEALSNIKNPPFLWNIIPMHPHTAEKSLSNRTPNIRDYAITEKAIKYFLNHTSFDRYFAIGRIAEKYLIQLKYIPIYIRHPSMGGASKFKEAIYRNFESRNRLGDWDV